MERSFENNPRMDLNIVKRKTAARQADAL